MSRMIGEMMFALHRKNNAGPILAAIALLGTALLTSCRSGSVSFARPHPDPLPQERENPSPRPDGEVASSHQTSVSPSGEQAAKGGNSSELPGRADSPSLSPGERAGVRASVKIDSSSSSEHSGLQRFEFKQPHMGTLFTITLYAPDETKARTASDAAFAKIAALERIMTDYDPESELMQLCQKPFGQPVRVSAELFEILQKSQRVAELTEGAFDVTVGPVVRLWRRARRTETLPSPDQLDRARESVGYRKLKLDPRSQSVTLTVPNMQLDLGSIGKGYAADRALQVLKSRGVTRALVAASGDIAAGDPPPGQRGWRVGIGIPDSAHGELARNLLLRNAAVSTSGDTEQFVVIGGRRYSHIVDPRTGVGLTERLQVSVIARHATETDSFDTAVSLLGVQRGLALVESQPGMAALILRKDGDKTEVFESRRFKRITHVE